MNSFIYNENNEILSIWISGYSIFGALHVHAHNIQWSQEISNKLLNAV